MGDLFAAPIPRCPVHNQNGGQMRCSMAADTWVCHGWDGEGCDYIVTWEDHMKNMVHIGTVDDLDIRLPWDNPDHDVLGDVLRVKREAAQDRTLHRTNWP